LNHTSHFTSFQLKFIVKNIATLVYLMENINLKNELLNYYFHSIKDSIKKTIIQATWKILVTKTLPKMSSLVSLLLHHITIESFTHYNTLYEGAWSPYSLIMDCYIFLGTLLKVNYVMTIQKLSMKFIQCD